MRRGGRTIPPGCTMKFMAARRPWKANSGLRSSLSHFPMASTMRSSARRPRKPVTRCSLQLRTAVDINVPADQIGRYAIDSLKGDVFKAALDFGATDGTQPGVETSQLASAAMLTEPLNDQHITEAKPTIKANLASMGDVDPKSVEMRISGFGPVPAV